MDINHHLNMFFVFYWHLLRVAIQIADRFDRFSVDLYVEEYQPSGITRKRSSSGQTDCGAIAE